MDMLKAALTRRTFFKGLITAAVATSVTTLKLSPALALTENKYVVTVRKSKLVVESATTRTAVRENHGITPEYRLADQAVNENVAALLTFMLDNFKLEDTPEVRRDLKRMFNGELTVDSMNAGDLTTIAETLVPIAVMREILARKRISFDPSTAALREPWDRFATSYHNLILSC